MLKFDKRFEGRVFQVGRALLEICCVGMTRVVVEKTEDAQTYMDEYSIADCEIGVLSGKWKPASFAKMAAS